MTEAFVAAALLGFGLLVVRRHAAWVAVAQAATVAIAAALACWASQDPLGVPVPLAAAAIGGLAWLIKPGAQPLSGLLTVPLGVLLVVAALVAVPSEPGALALAVVLLGLLAATSRPVPGALGLCQGGLLALSLSASPLRGAMAVALAALTAFVVTGSMPWRRA